MANPSSSGPERSEPPDIGCWSVSDLRRWEGAIIVGHALRGENAAISVDGQVALPVDQPSIEEAYARAAAEVIGEQVCASLAMTHDVDPKEAIAMQDFDVLIASFHLASEGIIDENHRRARELSAALKSAGIGFFTRRALFRRDGLESAGLERDSLVDRWLPDREAIEGVATPVQAGLRAQNTALHVLWGLPRAQKEVIRKRLHSS